MRHPLGALSAVRQAGANRRVQGRRGEAGELSASSRAGLLPLLPPLFDGSAFRFVARATRWLTRLLPFQAPFVVPASFVIPAQAGIWSPLARRNVRRGSRF